MVGAGAFGGWTALSLLRQGARVTLVDAWGPGNARASSAGETRVIRAVYGTKVESTRLAVRALSLWKENERRFRKKLLHRSGVLWLATGNDAYIQEALPHLRAARLPFDEMDPAEAARRYPQISMEGVARCVLEREAGFLLAREACHAVFEAFVAEGGEYRQAQARPLAESPRKLTRLELADGSTLKAERFVFACGPWLGEIVPALLGTTIRPTRQEVFVFGTPAGDTRYLEEELPVWIDYGDRLVYGIPAGTGRGLKIADDTRGARIDPTSDDRLPSASGLAAIRRDLARRFPALAAAPLLEASICQYEESPDGRFIIDRHPEAPHVVLVGGGSGHGFKHGPAIGELVAAMVLEDQPAGPEFCLARFNRS